MKTIHRNSSISSVNACDIISFSDSKNVNDTNKNRKPFKTTNISRDFKTTNKSIGSVIKLRNSRKQDYWTSKHENKSRKKGNANEHLNGFGMFSVKYKTVRTPGCCRPVFMFIDRGSIEDATILRDSIDSGMSHLILARNGQIYHKINANQCDILENYSLI